MNAWLRALGRRHPWGGPVETRPRLLPGEVRGGFTLMECLVVVACLSMLAGLLYPVLASAREEARRSRCLSNLRQLAGAYHLYLQNWDERLPDWLQPSLTRTRLLGRRLYWTEYLLPYLRSEALFHDASAVGKPFDGLTLADYALLTWGPSGRWTLEEPHFRWPGAPMRLADVVRPAESIQFADGWTTTAGSAIDAWAPTGGRTESRLRHRGGLNAAFVDGHARWLPEDQFWRVTTDGRGLYWLHYATADR
jgi:prepilin-type N-terminal cleavage/methylation domain-containing protein/prepilin-type processing-associated H-X9-DG protein